jgi:hypothetical protein
MPMSSVLIGIALVIVLALIFGGGWHYGIRRKETARRLTILELRYMAEKLGITLDWSSIGKTREGSGLLDAMILCQDCPTVESCNHFLDTETEPVSRLTALCPNAVYLLGLVERQRREQSASQGI